MPEVEKDLVEKFQNQDRGLEVDPFLNQPASHLVS